eukprot:SAG22_NODE_61_length_23387_cov_34.380582_4_plen_367_part_00
MQAHVRRGMEQMIGQAADEVVDILAEKYGFSAAEAKQHLGLATPAEGDSEPRQQQLAAVPQLPASPSGLPRRRSMQSLFRDRLLTRDGLRDTSAVLAGKKHLGIYFSAQWCQPRARDFTAQLARWHRANAEKLGVEIVFVSSDKDQGSFDEYFAEMPWPALPFAERDLKSKLAKQYKASVAGSLPALVIVDGEGKLVTDRGRGRVAADPTGADFPWRPRTFLEIFAGGAVDKSGAEHSLAAMVEDCEAVGILFSAHYCPPCRRFTPKLAESYEAMRAAGKKWDIVFASFDRDQAAFDAYLGEMPWKALPFGDKRKDALNELFGVSGAAAVAHHYMYPTVLSRLPMVCLQRPTGRRPTDRPAWWPLD